MTTQEEKVSQEARAEKIKRRLAVYKISDAGFSRIRRRVGRQLKDRTVSEIVLMKRQVPHSTRKLWKRRGWLIEIVDTPAEPVAEEQSAPVTNGEEAIRTLGDSIKSAAVNDEEPKKKRGRPKGTVTAPKKEERK